MRVEGKKENIKSIEYMPLNVGYKCNKCNHELVKLRTALGKPIISESKGKVFQDFYWICLCANELCERKYKEVKVFERVTEVMEYPKIGRYRDRTNIGGR